MSILGGFMIGFVAGWVSGVIALGMMEAFT